MTRNKAAPSLAVVDGQPVEPAKGPGQQRSPVVGPHGLTIKQELFAVAVAEGKTFSDAYRHAYDADNMVASTVWRNAHELATHNKVTARLEGLWREKQAQLRMQSLSRADLVLSELQAIALSDKVQDGARVRALELLGKSVALRTDRVETENKTERTADEIEAGLRERLKRLGVA